MRVSLNKKGGTDKLQGVTFVCSPVEALVIIDALRKVAEDEDTHPKDRLIAERMLADIADDRNDTDDLISRQDAIKPFCIAPDGTRIPEVDCDNFPVEFSVEFIKKHLLSLPSAEPKTGWIPCSERLPDERQDVYVTVLWDDYGDYITAYGMRTRFGWHLHSNAEGELIKGYTVIAWMPLPEPYRKDGEI